jgi:hypothetical protein
LIDFFSNSARLHVLLNHVPTVGFGMGLGLFVLALIKRVDGLKRTSLVIFFVVANVAIATYVTGNGAESVLTARNVTVNVTHGSQSITSAGGFVGSDRGRQVRIGGNDVYLVTTYFDADRIVVDRPLSGESDAAVPAQFLARPGIVPEAVRQHEDAALVAFAVMEVTGFFAWLALWQWRRAMRLPGWMSAVVLLMSVVTFALMARAADLGGEISHAELRTAVLAPGQEPTAGAGLARSLGLIVSGGQTWVWPACETLHFIGLCMLFMVVLILDLRMLGMAKRISFAAVYQLLPIGMLGFGINLVTGMLFFIGVPGQYVHNVTFFWKIAFVLLGGLNVLYFILDDEPWTVGPGDEAPLVAKVAAASAMFIWSAVLFCGHMLPFIGNAF